VPVGIIWQISEGDNSFEISSMPVNIACDDQAAFGRQINKIAASKFIFAAGLYGLV
jgi:hypothetical protein